MKNSKNKILAAVVCGLITGSIGTSIVGKFQGSSSDSSSYTASSSTNSTTEGSSSSSQGTYEGNTGQGKGNHHKGAGSVTTTETVDVASGSYVDGVYEGTAAGYAQGLTVEVTIVSGAISDIEIVSSNETPGFCERAFETVPAEIIQNQNTDVDTASGATYSSIGIINAVNNALSEAQA